MSDLNELCKIPFLTILNLQGIKTCPSVSLQCARLTFINVSCMQLTDEQFNLRGCPLLTEVICYSNQLTTVEAFVGLKSLMVLDLENNQIETVGNE